MTDTQAMVDSAGTAPSAEFAAAIDALRDCAQASTACAMAMVEAGGMPAEVRLSLDCADLCVAAERVLSRGAGGASGVVTAAVDAAVAACAASAAACGAHADHNEHCRLHSASAQTCADTLRALRR